ncbi:MAG TPA: DNA polymerase III subunit alpha [Candidatus Hydrogenedentes bacterium]|nr:DNA polymerase III subunit alpha [FCB group bacterium]HNZ20212.1 DNA polymerase III subunit alpha [Candidatus Hydrogenedentota bacterium]HOH35613.1 DNA polymerase III subunit alpha [Candidatus Hydrogenedentota bacterium]HPA05210.1 DNA polymerase III subunit alpha [Candidatus Hydrogenedentota bacterium]HPV38990.1 DNA polymerase III subunit alpha [Candidatus Hydrogenedentota bacterium]
MIPLHVHSNYSMLEGTAPVERLVERAASYGLPALALTDTGGLYGAVPFYRAARAAGIKPIIGVFLEHTVLLARDREGYAQLCRLVTAYHLEEAFDLAARLLECGRVFVLADDAERIRRLHRNGLNPLVALTHHGDAVSRYRATRLHDLAAELGLRCVAVNPVYFLQPEEYRVHRVLSAIRCNATVDTLETGDAADAACWFRPPEEMRRLYVDWPDALRNAEWVAEECRLELPLGRPLFPGVELPGGETPFSHLWKLAFEGVKRRYTPLNRRVIERLHHELDIIERLGFAPYFIIVEDIVNFARARDIPVVGRGSAANSLVAYALGITRVDPFKYDLYFERFLNPSRSDCPDIDLDICWRRRDRVVNYVYERYGAGHVAMIATFNTFQARSSVREVAKAMGLTGSEIGEVTRRLPHYHAGDIQTVVRHLPECRELPIHEEPLRSIVAIAEAIDQYPRHIALHPCGLVIAPEPLTRFVPLQRAAKGFVVTQYDMHPIEHLGLIKMDLLGHRSLTVIDETVQQVWDNRGIRLDVENLPEPDPNTADLIRNGRTIGCFQIESPAMRTLLRNTQAADTDMLIKTLSLVRPGPSGSGMKKRFIARHLGREPVEYLHPALERVLGDTCGVMLYQEDILKVANVIAGMDLAEGDLLRRAMTKKRSPREMAKSMKTFIEKAVANGIAEAVAEEIWGLIANFAAYSYCKAHAATYGEIAYQCTYLKAHFPAEFMACVLSNRGGFYHPAVYVEEARRLGIEVRPPDINKSRCEYVAEGDAIRVGFVEVRQLAQDTVEAILAGRANRPFESLADVWARAGITRPEAEALLQAGAFDAFGRTRPALFWELHLLSQGGHGETPAGADRLFREHGGEYRTVPRLPDVSRKKRTDQEWEALGLVVSTHPLEYYASLFQERALVSSADLPRYVDRVVMLVGWLIAERRVGLKGRGCMKFCTFEDPKGVFEGVLFPETYQRYGRLLDSHGPYFVLGRVQNDDDYCSLIVEELERVDATPKSPGASDITPPKHWIFPGAREE